MYPTVAHLAISARKSDQGAGLVPLAPWPHPLGPMGNRESFELVCKKPHHINASTVCLACRPTTQCVGIAGFRTACCRWSKRPRLLYTYLPPTSRKPPHTRCGPARVVVCVCQSPKWPDFLLLASCRCDYTRPSCPSRLSFLAEELHSHAGPHGIDVLAPLRRLVRCGLQAWENPAMWSRRPAESWQPLLPLK